jgi:hypothetical protein
VLIPFRPEVKVLAAAAIVVMVAAAEGRVATSKLPDPIQAGFETVPGVITEDSTDAFHADTKLGIQLASEARGKASI